MVRAGNYKLMAADCLPRSLMEEDWTDNTDNVDRSISPAPSFVILCHLDIKVTHLSVSMELLPSFQTVNWGLCHQDEKVTFSSTDRNNDSSAICVVLLKTLCDAGDLLYWQYYLYLELYGIEQWSCGPWSLWITELAWFDFWWWKWKFVIWNTNTNDSISYKSDEKHWYNCDFGRECAGYW